MKITNDDDYYTGKTLCGAYQYYDPLGREENTTGGGTAYQWYRMDSEDDENPDAIEGATGQSYTLTAADAGKYIYFAVTPKADGSVAGDTQESWYIGPVKQIDDTATSVTAISVVYKGQELLGDDFDTAQKTYKLNFATDEGDRTAMVTATGSNITINGASTGSAMIDFEENDLVEVRDTAAGSSYFIKLNDMPAAAAVGIEGDDTIAIVGTGYSEGMQKATAYDQYGEALSNVTFTWTVPDGYEYSVEGNCGQFLYIAADSSTPEGTIAVTAEIQDNALLSSEKAITFQSGVDTDTTAPELVDDTITPGGLSDSGVTLSWDAATDDVSAPEDLMYAVYQSGSDNIGSAEDAEANGTMIGSWQAGIGMKEITGLDAGETCYFNVVVKDEAGNKMAYATVEVTTDEAVTYVVTYDANDGAGAAPTETDKAEGAEFAAAENTFTAPDGKQFKEWNTDPDEEGTSYAEGATVTMPGHALTLYAIWQDISGITYTVTYDANSGSGTAPTETDMAEGLTFAAAENTFTPPDGKQFREWNTEPGGGGESYAESATVTMPGHALTLYAVWQDVPAVTYTVTYDANGGAGIAPTETDKSEGAAFAAAENTFTPPDGKQFREWNTEPGGGGESYAESATVTMPGHAVTLYAVWQDIPTVTYTVTYDANGGAGIAPTETDKSEGAAFAAAENTFTAPEGKQFKEWNTKSNGSGVSYAEGAAVAMPGHALTLYAIWKNIPTVKYTVTYDANGGTGTTPDGTKKAKGAAFEAAENTFTAPDGKQFKEWNTKADGSGTSYAEGEAVTMPGHALTPVRHLARHPNC